MRHDRGLVLWTALLFLTVAGLLLSGLALRATAAVDAETRRARREEALHEAWGGIRQAAAEGKDVLRRSDAEGTLVVERAGGRLAATYTTASGETRRASVAWRDGRFSDWRED